MLANGADTTGILRATGDGFQEISVMATLSNVGWIGPTKPFQWLVSRFKGEKENVFVKYATRIVKNRQALRENDPIAYNEEKDMLYRFMESIHPITGDPLDDMSLIKVGSFC